MLGVWRSHIRRAGCLPTLVLLAAATAAGDFSSTVNTDGTLTLTRYTGSGGAVAIPAVVDGRTVTRIGPVAFSDCTRLTRVTLPASVTTIAEHAFDHCTRLTRVALGDGLTHIGSSAFAACISLTNVVIPARVTSIGGGAFADCTRLTTVRVGHSVTSIGGGAFADCVGLTGIYFLGDAPAAASTVFAHSNQATVYYLPGTAGWGPWFDGRPTRLWPGAPSRAGDVCEVASPTADGTWDIGAVIAITVTFRRPVTVTGRPQLLLETGATDALATYAGGTGTTTLTFRYTVAAGHTSPDLDYRGTSALAQPGGTIRDASGGRLNLALPPPGAPHSLSANQDLVIDGSAPTAALTCAAAEPTSLTPIPFTVIFSKPVTGFDVDDVTVLHGTTVTLSGSGATYSLAVAPSAQGRVTVSVAAGGCVSVAGIPNRASAALSRTYDTVRPTSVDVSSPTPDGTYGPGAVIPITVTFSEPVIVTGRPQLALETGPTDALAPYVGSEGTTTLTLTFHYTVAAGQISPRLNCVGTSALTLPGGTLRDAAGNPAVLTLPAPGTAHSLSANRALTVAAAGAPNGPFLAHVTALDVAAGRGLWNLTGTYATTVAGNRLTWTLVHDPGGALTGSATLQVRSGESLLPLTLPVSGHVRGNAGVLRMALRLRGTDPAGTRQAALTLDLTLDADGRQLRGLASGSIEAPGLRTPIAEAVALALPPRMDGTWALRFDLQQVAKLLGGTATLTLSNGVAYPLAVQGQALGPTAVLSLSAQPADRPAAGIRMRAEITTLGGPLTPLTTFSGKAFGQTLAWP